MVGFTAPKIRARAKTWKCSTPFGVMVGFTRGAVSVVIAGISAQRLSASWSDSHDRLLDPRRIRDVLNAFRRHGRIHGCPVEPIPCRATCAQRLSASWSDSRSGARSITRLAMCAQRLSASWSDSHERDRQALGRGRVLNAFRRHGRIHLTEAATPCRSITCSTPFGVMVGFTAPPQVEAPQPRRTVIFKHRHLVRRIPRKTGFATAGASAIRRVFGRSCELFMDRWNCQRSASRWQDTILALASTSWASTHGDA